MFFHTLLTLRNKCIVALFTALFLLLLLLYYPSFRNPPRSDYWPAFFFFHLVRAGTGPPSWLHVLTYDPWSHGTFRPLSFFILYLEHLLFGSGFVGNHIVNFLMYFLSILLLYRLARNLSLDRFLSAAVLSVYAFFFSHFDIITWTFHLYSILAFCAFLMGFSLYISFLKTGGYLRLIGVGILFLLGMLSYEVFALWPPAILILAFFPHLFPVNASRGRRRLLDSVFLLGGVYFIYAILFFLIRTIGSFQVGPLLGERTPISGPAIALSALSVFFNLLYTGIAVNISPLLAVPAMVKDNIDMGGFLLNAFPRLRLLVILGGAATFLLVAGSGAILFKRKRFRTLGLLLFFIYLLFCFFFIVSLGRSITNLLIYPFSQFRYQYVANALTVLIALVLLDNLLRPSHREKVIVCLALIPILFSNIYITRTYILILKNQLEPLQAMLANIKIAIKDGRINRGKKLYIEDGITRSLPPLCWNDDMEIYMRGTYQWLFSRREIEYFTPDPEEAAWIIGSDSIKMVECRPDKTKK